MQKLAIIGGVVLAGLAPSFIDWQEAPEKRGQMVLFYGVAATLILVGLWDGG